jgi:hypothetical protein
MSIRPSGYTFSSVGGKLFFMRKIISSLLLLPLAVVMMNCTDDRISPRETNEDQVTSAREGDRGNSLRAYSRNVFAIELTALKYTATDPLPAPLEMNMTGTGGMITVNWGDGTIEQIALHPSFMFLNHQYNEEKMYTIEITGDIRNISRFVISHQEINLNDIHLGGLTGLRSINIIFTKSAPEVIDLSRNLLIQEVDIFDLANLRKIVIPTSNNINSIVLYGTGLTTQSVDQAIDRVYKSVLQNPRPGTFALSVSWAQPDESDAMVGPPSSRSLEKLKILRNSFGWNIQPDFDNN